MTIQQIQAYIDAQSLDPRQLINLIADYLQANPDGGGGAATLQTVLDEGGTLDKDNFIAGGGYSFAINNANAIVLNTINQDDSSSAEIKPYAYEADEPYIKMLLKNAAGDVTLDFVLEKDSVTISKNSGAPQEVATVKANKYVAEFRQLGTANPTVVVKENSFDADIVWARSGAGVYVGTLSGAFQNNQTYCPPFGNSQIRIPIGDVLPLDYSYNLSRTSNNTVALTVYKNSDNAPVEYSDILDRLFIEIIVYP